MNHVFQSFVDSLSCNPDTAALQREMEKVTAAFDLSSFAYFLSDRESLIRPKLISNYPADWTGRYLAEGYGCVDPVIGTALHSTEPFEWGEGSWPQTPGKVEKKLLAEAAYFGIRHGFTIPIHDRSSRFAAVTFAANEGCATFRRCFEVHRPVLQLLAYVFHSEARRALALPTQIGDVSFTAREIECLTWAARGKSMWDTGQILGISRRTVAFHVGNAKSKLGVRTIQQAVALLAESARKAP